MRSGPFREEVAEVRRSVTDLLDEVDHRLGVAPVEVADAVEFAFFAHLHRHRHHVAGLDGVDAEVVTALEHQRDPSRSECPEFGPSAHADSYSYDSVRTFISSPLWVTSTSTSFLHATGQE